MPRPLTEIELKKQPGDFRITCAGVGSPATIQAEEVSGDGKGVKLGRFSGNAYTGTVMKPEGFWEPIVVDLDGIRIPSQHRPALRQHDHEQIVGHTESVRANQKEGIPVEGVFSGEKQHTVKVTDPASKGFKWQLSIGANPIRREYLDAGESTEVNGRTVTGPLTIMRETELGEVSFVPLGADGDTSVKVAASKGRTRVTPEQIAAAKAALKSLKLSRFSDDDINEMDGDTAKETLKKCMFEDDIREDEKKKAAKAAEKEAEDKEKEKTEAGRKSLIKAAVDEALSTFRKETTAETNRQNDIRARAERYNVTTITIGAGAHAKEVNLVAHAIENNWSANDAELYAIRAARPGPYVGVGPHIHIPGGVEVTDGMLVAAVMQAARHEFRLEDESFYKDEEGRMKHPESVIRNTKRMLASAYTEKEQDHAHKIYKGQITLQKLIYACARSNGYTGSEVIGDSNGSEAMRFAAGRAPDGRAYGGVQIRAEGTSTASLSNVTANVQNKFLLQGYLFVEGAWREIAQIIPLKDFKPSKSVSLMADTQVQPVGPSGELQNAILDDQAFANQADQYGRILTINRKNIINDDLGALTTAPILMGKGAGRGLNALFWGVWLNPGNGDDGNTFYSSSRNAPADPLQKTANSNLVASGAGSALQSTSLQSAKLLYDNQIDPFGYPLGDDASVPVLLFPPDLWLVANELVDPAAVGLVIGASSTTRQPNINMWKGRLKPVMSRYLNKTFVYNKGPLGGGQTATATGSTTAWYVVAQPFSLPAIQVTFLQGVDTPTVQMASPDWQFDRLGMSMRVIFDYGVNMQNFRAAVKSPGA